MKIALAILLSASISTGAFAYTELKGDPNDLREFLHPRDKIVGIYAEAEKTAYSDKAIVTLIVTTEAKLLSDSLSKNSQIRTMINKQLTANGISADHIKSSKFSTSPQYGWFGKKPSSFRVVNRMAVSVTNESHLEIVASVSDSMQEVVIAGTEFEHTKKDEFATSVKEMAFAKAMKQKEFYEKSLGIKLKPIGISSEKQYQQPTHGATIIEEVMVTAAKRSSNLRDSPTSLSAAYSESEPSFDEVKYEAGIRIEFKIVD